jgi:carbonic anhydrase/acetyltransferase-like protein (isoleucine patch superfamily)
MNLHPAVSHASMGKMRSGAAMVHPIEHWTHLLRVNLLAMLSRGEQYRLDFERAPIWSKLFQVLKVLWNSNGLSIAGLAHGLSRIGKGCNIHPTAVVEATELGDGVEVGPFAVLRGCVVGAGAKIEAYGHASLSVIGPKARVGDGAMINLAVLMPEAFVSRGDGFQMSLFGSGSFVAVGATILDLSFGKTIRVDHDGERRDSEVYFLGACIGHRAKVGNGVRISYGTVVPNDSFLVGPSHDLLRRWPTGTESPARVVEGAALSVRRGDS